MKGSISIKYNFKNKKEAGDAKITLEKEINTNKRFSSKISLENNTLIIDIEGDAVSLRATANSFLRYLQIIEGINGGNENGQTT
ncbi:MAG: KEOPS complex subunit Pcc1 [Candidatus Micrarchaeia archaeon]